MIRNVLDIMIKDYIVVDVLDGLRHIQNIALDNQKDVFLVMEENKIVGVLTYRDLMQAHPNRIVADAMSDNFEYIDQEMSVWKAKRLFDESCIEILLVLGKKELLGIITKPLIDRELGKHVDLLTGLYRSDYIYYNAMKLIESGHEISMIFLDVNNFGRIDKKYGHINGDIILQEIGSILKKQMLPETYLVRFGGDEFLILTPYDLDRCNSFAQKILQAVSCYNFHNNIPITASAGIVGRNSYFKNENSQSTFVAISKLINSASLASTKAKKDKCDIFVVNNFNDGDAVG